MFISYSQEKKNNSFTSPLTMKKEADLTLKPATLSLIIRKIQLSEEMEEGCEIIMYSFWSCLLQVC